MYVNSAFKTDDSTAWAFVAERGFGTVVAIDRGPGVGSTGDAGTPVAAQVPLLVTGEGARTRIEFHVARANPLHLIIAANPRVLVTVSGPDAYISPDWYVSADQVPTWNYTAAHLTGTATTMAPDAALTHVENMSLAFERRLLPKKPWSTSKMTPDRRAMMLRAIVPISIEVERIECAFKLSQNKTVPDRIEAARMLDWRGSPGERGVSLAMRAQLKASMTAAKTETV